MKLSRMRIAVPLGAVATVLVLFVWSSAERARFAHFLSRFAETNELPQGKDAEAMMRNREFLYPRLEAVLRGNNRLEKREALRCLSVIGQSSDRSARIVLEAVTNLVLPSVTDPNYISDATFLSDAIILLGNINSPISLPFLVQIVQTSPAKTALDNELKCHAVRALGNLGPLASNAIPVILSLITSDFIRTNRDLATFAIEAAGNIRIPNESVVAAFTELLETPHLDSETMEDTLLAIETFGYAGTNYTLLDPLLKIITHPQDPFINRAASTIASLAPALPPKLQILCAQKLVGLLHANSTKADEGVIRALANCGTNAAPAIPILQALARSAADAGTREQCAEALRVIRGH